MGACSYGVVKSAGRDSWKVRTKHEMCHHCGPAGNLKHGIEPPIFLPEGEGGEVFIQQLLAAMESCPQGYYFPIPALGVSKEVPRPSYRC